MFNKTWLVAMQMLDQLGLGSCQSGDQYEFDAGDGGGHAVQKVLFFS